MKNKVFGYLGLAARGRKISTGETCYQDVVKRKAKLVILASDSSVRTKERMQHTCNSCDVPCISCLTSIEISSAIGQVNRMSVAVLDEGLATQILNCLK